MKRQINTYRAQAMGLIVGTALTLMASAHAAVAKDDAVAAQVPENLKQSGTLRIAMPDIGKPLAYKDGQALKGMDVELAQAVAEVMGLKPQISLIPFSAALTGLQADKYDISYGEFYVTTDRLKVADFVTHWQDYSSFLVVKTKGYTPTDLKAICGRKVGAMAGSAELATLNTAAAQCESKPAVSAFPSVSNAVLALNSGRVDGVLINRGGAQGAIVLDAGLDASGEIGGGPTATAVARRAGSEQLLTALKMAYDHLIATGDYAKILANNDTTYGAAQSAVIYKEGSEPPKYGF